VPTFFKLCAELFYVHVLTIEWKRRFSRDDTIAQSRKSIERHFGFHQADFSKRSNVSL